ncbi:D-glycero-beta-D-manno-heptose 1,7-bisphosphate 7-phosphatase [Aurantivibrio plasticivorans]
MTSSNITQLVILDRDGVINHDSDAYIKSVDEWNAIPGSLEAIAKLSKAGFSIGVATNQSGLGRGLFDLDDLEAMHAKMVDGVAEFGGEIAGIFYCPHHPDEDCNCRKPRTGLVDAMESEFGIAAKGAPFVGDNLKDLQTGLAKGCVPILVRTGKGEHYADNLPDDVRAKTTIVADLAEAADYILKHFSVPN